MLLLTLTSIYNCILWRNILLSENVRVARLMIHMSQEESPVQHDLVFVLVLISSSQPGQDPFGDYISAILHIRYLH